MVGFVEVPQQAVALGLVADIHSFEVAAKPMDKLDDCGDGLEWSARRPSRASTCVSLARNAALSEYFDDSSSMCSSRTWSDASIEVVSPDSEASTAVSETESLVDEGEEFITLLSFGAVAQSQEGDKTSCLRRVARCHNLARLEELSPYDCEAFVQQACLRRVPKCHDLARMGADTEAEFDGVVAAGGLRRVPRCYDLLALGQQQQEQEEALPVNHAATRQSSHQKQGGLRRIARCLDLEAFERQAIASEVAVQGGLRRIPRSFDLQNLAATSGC